MKRTISFLMFGVLFPFVIGLSGCGDDVGQPERYTLDISQLTSLTKGSYLSIGLTGFDYDGGTYDGKVTYFVDGPTSYENQEFIKKTITVWIYGTNNDTNFYGVTTSYYNKNRTLYKNIYSDGVVATPTNIFYLPKIIKTFDQFEGQDLICSNGITITGEWSATPLNEDFLSSFRMEHTLNYQLEEASFFTISKNQGFTGVSHLVINNFPILGRLTSLEGHITSLNLGNIDLPIYRD